MIRRSKWPKEMRETAAGLRASGLTYQEIAEKLGPCKSTIRCWLNEEARQHRMMKSAEYHAANREEVLLRRQQRYELSRAKNIEWRKENKARYLANYANWAKVNRDKLAARNARRRAQKKMATPPWLTAEQYAEIEKYYTEASRLSLETGLRHHVDHLYPLVGRGLFGRHARHVSCGLHVPWNLQVLTASENCSKGCANPDPETPLAARA